jgi:hypothetical protein
LIDDLDDFDDIPPPPPPEFDRDAEYALASPGLFKEERLRITNEARSLAVRGVGREALGNWICREVARTVGGRSGFEAIDAEGNVIDPPHVADARKHITREAGRKSQTKRNSDIEPWRQRCKQMLAPGLSESDVLHRALAAIHAYHNELPIPRGFEDLPVIYGRDGKSPPKDRKRLRDQIFGRARRTS